MATRLAAFLVIVGCFGFGVAAGYAIGRGSGAESARTEYSAALAEARAGYDRSMGELRLALDESQGRIDGIRAGLDDAVRVAGRATDRNQRIAVLVGAIATALDGLRPRP